MGRVIGLGEDPPLFCLFVQIRYRSKRGRTFSVENWGCTILRQFKERHVSGDVTLPLIIILRS